MLGFFTTQKYKGRSLQSAVLCFFFLGGGGGGRKPLASPPLRQDSYGPMSPPNVGLSEAQRWATLFFFKRLRKQPGCECRDFEGRFWWFWGVRFMVGLGGGGLGRIQGSVWILAILDALKLERLKKLDETHIKYIVFVLSYHCKLIPQRVLKSKYTPDMTWIWVVSISCVSSMHLRTI